MIRAITGYALFTSAPLIAHEWGLYASIAAISSGTILALWSNRRGI